MRIESPQTTCPGSSDAQKLGFAYVYGTDGTLLGEYGMGGSASTGTTQYIYLPTANGPMPIAAIVNGVAYAVHSDHLNTPRKLTQPDGQVAWQWAYSAFGDEQPTLGSKRFTDATTNPTTGTTTIPEVTFNLRYPGQYYDKESNLHYNYFRSYSAERGRYTQADPIGLDGGFNRFGYVEGDALSYADPFGLEKLILIYPTRDPMIYGAALAYPNPENALVIISHGSEKSVRRMNAQELAAYIKKHTKWKPGQPIILNACNTGKGEDSIAEQLSRVLGGNTVVAPDQFTWNVGLWDVGPFAARADNPNRADYSKPGNWICFGECARRGR